MIDERFVLLAALMNILGSGTYILNTLQGKTKPNRVTWFLWALAPLIAFSAQWGEGVRWQSLMTFMAGFCPLLIFLASFVNKNAVWKITRFDLLCGLCSVIALVLWLVTGEGLLAILLSITADLMAGVPTLVKAFKEPETEHPTAFLSGAFGAVITMLTIKHWSIANAGFAVYVFCMCSTLYVLVQFKLGKRFIAAEGKG